MKTSIHPDLINLANVQEADSILRKCVHCGFCTATCPTYQLLGDELDGPRGRIYLIKNLLEENTIDNKSRLHLDRCLTCRACETTCPSGVEYGRLLDIGREFAETRSKAPLRHRLLARALRLIVPRRWLFHPLLKLGQLFRPILPSPLQAQVPASAPVQWLPPEQKQETSEHDGVRENDKAVLLLTGCVQSAATPNVVASLQKILACEGRPSALINEGCCGALDYHLSAHNAGIDRMKRVVDQLYPMLPQAEAIVSSATGCGVTIKEYPEMLKHLPDYAARAQAIVEKLRDPVELLADLKLSLPGGSVAVHTPCSMQHGLKLQGQLEALLTRWGFTVHSHAEAHLCCGSAGSYSILQPELSARLRTRKLGHLEGAGAAQIVTANIGCQMHLGAQSTQPVHHWLEAVAAQLPPTEARGQDQVPGPK